MKQILFAILAMSISLLGYANPVRDKIQRKDTLLTELKNDIVIVSSIKETNSLKNLPAAVSVFSPKSLESMQIKSLKDLSSFIPNYSVASYGSKMTAPVYIRGIGARSGSQTVSMYVDNIPYFNTTALDCELTNIQRVEVLRGTQSTLYGRNAMGGLLNIYTYSPLDYQGTDFSIGGGSYGDFSVKASHLMKLGETTGISVSGFYNRNDGYFRNQYTGGLVDHMQNAGGRVKFAWNLTPRWTASLSTGFDYVDQGAFPYEDIGKKEIAYNSDGYYKRKLSTNGLALRYSGNAFEINSTTGYQYLNDEMNMDQDYTKASIFQINQRQNEHSLSQEITIKSTNNSNYQWSSGVFGFYDYLKTTAPVDMMKDGIDQYLQSGVDHGMGVMTTMIEGMIRKQMAEAGLPPMMIDNAVKKAMAKIPDNAKISDNSIELGGLYRNKVYGGAVFHQSTYNNLFVKGLSVTAGVRLDYEKTSLDYLSQGNLNFDLYKNIADKKALNSATALLGKTSNDYLEVLPKAVIKYQFNEGSHVYASVSRGYKTGGHNIQMFADLLQESLQQDMTGVIVQEIIKMAPSGVISGMPPMGGKPGASTEASFADRISFKPEYSWSYEVGGKVEILKNKLEGNFAAYYMDIKDVQITQFVNNRGGRMIANAGKARSQGFELGLKARPCTGVFLYANYGFSDAKFKNYDGGVDKAGNKIDYSDNYIPFAPRSTFSVGGSVSYNMKRCTFLDKITLDANYAGTGKIYWNEANSMSQGFHGDLDARLAFHKSKFSVEVWSKNLLNKDYHTFVFESRGMNFGQKSKPFRIGASFKIKL